MIRLIRTPGFVEAKHMKTAVYLGVLLLAGGLGMERKD